MKHTDEENKEETTICKVKSKVALIVGYNGTDFCGSQKNAGVRTIEGVVEEALYKSKLISKFNYGELAKIAWSRATRTDKRVHAL